MSRMSGSAISADEGSGGDQASVGEQGALAAFERDQ